tara:strand:- start:2797 stop:3246 length:450 start_codon:yes stop_codon:yes gene_type:complete
MTLRDLLRTSSFASLFNELHRHYYIDRSDDSLVDLCVSYRKAIGELIYLEGRSSKDWELDVSTVSSSARDPESYVDVSLRTPSSGKIYGLDLVLWEEVIDLPVTFEDSMSPLVAVAHILWELTWYGFTSAQIKAQRDSLPPVSQKSLDY